MAEPQYEKTELTLPLDDISDEDDKAAAVLREDHDPDADKTPEERAAIVRLLFRGSVEAILTFNRRRS